MVIDSDRLYWPLIDSFASFFLVGKAKLKGLDIAFHFSELFFFDCILATNLFERDVILSHLLNGRSYYKLLMNSYNDGSI